MVAEVTVGIRLGQGQAGGLGGENVQLQHCSAQHDRPAAVQGAQPGRSRDTAPRGAGPTGALAVMFAPFMSSNLF